ncbi:MAG: ABC transporter substrate-binding protein [Thermodesulfobacteriota bacterium]
MDKVYRTKRLMGILVMALLSAIVLGRPGFAGQEPKGATLKVALLPIIDALPYYVAEKNGYFDEEGIAVTMVPVASALDRDQLMQSGAVDGMLNEMASAAMFNRQSIKVQVVASCRASQKGYPLFRILAAPDSGIGDAAELAGIPIGISKNTIIEYVTDRLLSRQGLMERQLTKRSVPAIPERYHLLMNGQIKAATLPDPLAASAMASGAHLVVDDSSYPLISVSVLSFSTAAVTEKKGMLRGFLNAWNRGAAEVNAAPDAVRSVLLEKIRVPKNVQDSYAIPPFQVRQVPAKEQWDDVMSWMTEKGLLDAPLEYHDSITPDFQ